MRRFVIMMLLLLFLPGCTLLGERIKDPVTFYYIHEDYQKDMNSVIVTETREAAGHRDDLPYLLALYAMGPSDEELQSLIPASTRIIPTEHTDAGIVLSLSEIPETMTDAQFTLAGACLALTCMELTDASQITVTAAGRAVTINSDNIMMFETAHYGQTEEAE